MNSAKYALICDILNLSPVRVAELAGVPLEEAAMYATPNGTIPDHVTRLVGNLWEQRTTMAAETLEIALEQAETFGHDPQAVNLSRYTSQESLDRAGHGDMTLAEHNALTGLIAAVLTGEGFNVNINWVTEEK